MKSSFAISKKSSMSCNLPLNEYRQSSSRHRNNVQALRCGVVNEIKTANWQAWCLYMHDSSAVSPILQFAVCSYYMYSIWATPNNNMHCMQNLVNQKLECLGKKNRIEVFNASPGR
eukprot:6214708-Pleurochrysis_carterae.AAC.3